MTARWLSVIGIGDGGLASLSPEASAALGAAETVFGGARHLAFLAESAQERVPWRSPLEASAADLEARRGRPVAVLATGDPSWFGVARWLRTLFSPEETRVLPAPSAFSLAAARLGWALEETACLSVHGRPLEAIGASLRPGARLLVLCENGASPAAIAARLAARGYGPSRLTVLEHLGGAPERIREAEAAGFALAGIADLNTVAVECRLEAGRPDHPLVPGLPDEAFRHDGKMTKRVLRALAVAALEPRPGALLWDVGAGSGSVSVEWLRAAPGARAIAVEPVAERRAMIEANAAALAPARPRIVDARAPAALAGLPAPDAVFIGGGLTEAVFLAAFDALKPGGRIVAHAVTLESEAILLALHEVHGGDLLRVSVERAEAVGAYRGWKPSMPVLHWARTKSTPDLAGFRPVPDDGIR